MGIKKLIKSNQILNKINYCVSALIHLLIQQKKKKICNKMVNNQRNKSFPIKIKF